ncbi:hypothetical protein D9M71_813700 [compost metagenome]
MEELLWKLIGTSFPSKMAFQIAFDRLEVLFALSYAVPCIQKKARYWTLPGAYCWREENMTRISAELRTSLESLGDTSPFISSGLVGGTAVQGLENLSQLEQFAPTLFLWR